MVGGDVRRLSFHCSVLSSSYEPPLWIGTWSMDPSPTNLKWYHSWRPAVLQPGSGQWFLILLHLDLDLDLCILNLWWAKKKGGEDLYLWICVVKACVCESELDVWNHPPPTSNEIIHGHQYLRVRVGKYLHFHFSGIPICESALDPLTSLKWYHI